jgi:glycosyltransferase involved in cell wall biosynthesis
MSAENGTRTPHADTGLPAPTRIRVLLIVRWPVGGIRTFLSYVYRCVDSSGYELSILAPDDAELRYLREDLRELGVTFLPIGGHVTSSRFAVAVGREILFGRPYDLVHSHGLISGMCAAVPARLMRKKHLMTLHDVFHRQMFLGLRGRMRRALLNLLMLMIDIVNPVGSDVGENLVECLTVFQWARIKKKVVVIRNGIEISRFVNAGRRDLRLEQGLGDDAFLIGFMGRFMSQKGFRYLLEAVEILRKQPALPFRPIILAFGQGGFIREEQAFVREKGLEGWCLFLPFTPNVASTLRGLDVVVIPSLWEACSLLPMEAMVAGTPVIGTDVIGLRETLMGSPAAIVPARDSASLARAIAEEMTHPSKKVSEEFRAEAARRFDVRRQAELIQSLYLDALGRKAPLR